MKNRDDGVAFLGQVTASTTHELQNVLAIIKENAGLMEDYILMNPDNLPDLLETVKRCIGKIKKQTYRGVDLTSGLNAFAHTTDRLRKQVNPYEITKQLIFLTKRIFLQKGIQITLTNCTPPLSLETDPVLFQKTLMMCLECLVDTLELKKNIRVSILNSDSGKGIEIYSDASPDNGMFTQRLYKSIKWQNLGKACKGINLIPEPMTKTGSGIRILWDLND